MAQSKHLAVAHIKSGDDTLHVIMDFELTYFVNPVRPRQLCEKHFDRRIRDEPGWLCHRSEANEVRVYDHLAD